MTASQEKLTNRRQEQRMPLQGLNLKIRKDGLRKRLQHYEDCKSVDLSNNGLAFTTDDNLHFNIPEKLEFILTIEDHQIAGTGVVCNKHSSASGTRYGLLILSCSPEIGTLLKNNNLSTRELKNLAANMAEQLVYSLTETDVSSECKIYNKQQQLIDACRSYLGRLGEMGVRMPVDASSNLIHPLNAVKIFRDSENNLLLRWHQQETNQPQQITVKIAQDQHDVQFYVDKEPEYKTVLQILELLGSMISSQFIVS